MQSVLSITPDILISNILPKLDFESKLRSEGVCKLFLECLQSIKEYHEKKESYFSRKRYPHIGTVPDHIIDILGKRNIVCMPQFNVDEIGPYRKVEKEITNFLLRHDFVFCRGEDASNRQYVAVSYHLWDSQNEHPQPFHNDVLIYYEKSESTNPALKNPHDHDMRKKFWKCNFNVDLKQLLEDGVTFPYGDSGSSFTLGSNKQNLRRISIISSLFYEVKIYWDWVCMNIHH